MAAFLAPPPGVLPSSFTGHGRLPGDSRSTRRSVAGVASRPPLSVTPRAVATPPSRPVRALPPGTAATGSAAPAGGAAGPPSAAARPPPPVRWPARPSTVARYKQARYVGEPTPPRRGRLRPEFYAPRPPALGSADGTASAITSAGAGGEENEEAELPLSLRREYAWARGSGYNTATRFASTWSFLGSVLARNWLIGQRWTYLAGGMTDEAVAVRRRRLGRDVRESILQLGPTFIKVGQLASSRADILPREVVEELSLLQDRVPGFGYPAAARIIEEELGAPVAELFAWFDTVPLAAASLSQVHRARLWGGEEVVVKVQRPRLAALFELDLQALRGVAQYLQQSKKYGGSTRDWIGVYDECRKVLFEEIDFELEAANGAQLAADFADTPWVRLPRTYPDYSSKRVLTMQYLPGIKISDVAGLRAAGMDTAVVAQRSAECYLRQILGSSGMFLADPHAGNTAVGPGETLYLYDAGMVGVLPSGIREGLVDVLFGVVEKDAKAVMDGLIRVGALLPPADPLPITRSIQFFLDNLGARPERDQTVAAIGDDLYSVAQDQPFRIPATFTFVLRAFSTLEGVALTLDPNFKFSAVAKPFADDLLARAGKRMTAQLDASAGTGGATGALRGALRSLLGGRGDVLFAAARQAATDTSTAAAAAPARIASMDATLARLERGDLRIPARATETERLLRAQAKIMAANNALVVGVGGGVAAAVAATSAEPGLGWLVWSGGGVAALGLVTYVRGMRGVGREERRGKAGGGGRS